MQILQLEEVTLEEELRIGSGYRLHSANYRNQAVIVKVFEGTGATQVRTVSENVWWSVSAPEFVQAWARNMEFNRSLWWVSFLNGTVDSNTKTTLTGILISFV